MTLPVIDYESTEAYEAWLQRRAATLPSSGEARLLADRSGAPRFGVLLVPDEAGVRDAAHVLARQIYPLWRGLDAASLESGLRTAVESDLDYVVVVEAGCVLEPHALHALARAVLDADTPDLLYADHDLVGADGTRRDPFFKPGWSPELLLSMDYVGPLVALAPRALRTASKIEGPPIRCVSDLLLRIVDEDLSVVRVPDVLASRQENVRSFVDWLESIPALEDVARRRSRQMEVQPAGYPGARHVVWRLTSAPRVSVVIATAFRGEHIRRCLNSLRALTDLRELRRDHRRNRWRASERPLSR